MTALPPPTGAPDPRMRPPGYDRWRDNMHWYHAGILAAAAVVTAALAGPAPIAAYTLASTVLLGLAAQVAHPKWSGRLHVWAIGVVWVGACVTAWRNPIRIGDHRPLRSPVVRAVVGMALSPPALTAGTLCALCIMFGWERLGLRFRKTRVRTQRILDRQAKWHIAEGFSRFCVEVGLDPYKTEDRGLHRRPRGVEWLLRTGPMTTEALRKLAHAVASFLELPHGKVTAAPTANAAVTSVRINTTDTLAHMAPWTPAPPDDITKRFSIGLDYDLDPLWLNIGDRHAAIIGTTGSGKSNAMTVPMCAYAFAPNAEPWLIDVAKAGEDYAPLRRLARVWATEPATAIAALRQLLVIARQRAEWKEANNISVFVPTPDMPRIGVFIEEAVTLMAIGGKEVTELLVVLITTCRSSGINLWFGVQRPEGRIFDTNVRSQIDVWVVLAVDSPRTTLMAFPQFPEMQCHLYPTEDGDNGYCAVYYPGLRYPVEGRTAHVQRPILTRFAHALAPLPPCTYPTDLIDAALARVNERQSSDHESTGGSPQVRSQAVDLTGLDRLIVNALKAVDGEQLRQADIVKQVPYTKQAVSQRVKVLTERGVIVNDDGWLSLPAEVMADG